MEANFQDLFAILKMQQQAQANELSDSNTAGSSAQKNSRKKSPVNNFGIHEDDTGFICVRGVPAVDQEPEFPALTDADVADIIRRLRDFLKETGPSQEDDLLKVLSPQEARQVLSEYNTLTNFVDRHPGFRQLHEELLSFLYYQDPEDDEDDYSTPTVAPGGAYSGLKSSACKIDQEPEQPAVAGDGGPRGARASSCSSTSYESAVEDDVEAKGVSLKDGCSQTPSRPRCLSRAMQAVQLTCDAAAQTHIWDSAQLALMELTLKERNDLKLTLKEKNDKIFELQERLVAQQEDHVREMKQLIKKLRNKPLVTQSPLQNEESFKEAEHFGNVGEGQCQLSPARPPPSSPLLCRKSPSVHAEPEDVKQHAVSVWPKLKPRSASMIGRPAARQRVPDFYALHWSMEKEAIYSSCAASPTKSRNEKQIEKIVHMVKKQQPNYTEQEIRRHVDAVRRSRGGFSQMTFNSIVALVISHMKPTTTRNKH